MTMRGVAIVRHRRRRRGDPRPSSAVFFACRCGLVPKRHTFSPGCLPAHRLADVHSLPLVPHLLVIRVRAADGPELLMTALALAILVLLPVSLLLDPGHRSPRPVVAGPARGHGDPTPSASLQLRVPINEKNAGKRNSRRRVARGHGRWPETLRSRHRRRG